MALKLKITNGMQILPAVYNALGKAFDASPTSLGYLTLSRALVQAFASPIGGIAGEILLTRTQNSKFVAKVGLSRTLKPTASCTEPSLLVLLCLSRTHVACRNICIAMLCRALLQQDTCHGGRLLAVGPHDSQLWALQLSFAGDLFLGHEWHR